MAPAFSKEAILQGSVDHLCLVCESYLRSDRETRLHVATAAHSRNLRDTDYIDKYRQDRIRKIKKWYYCEFCNVLVSTITKVRLHVEEMRHKENVWSQMLTRVDDFVLCGEVLIQEDAWHGFVDENTCALCNLEFEDKDDHRGQTTHIINLIQSKISDDFINVYRKIDVSTFHCLTCNKVVGEITSHLEDTKHVNLLQRPINIKTLTPKKDRKNDCLPGDCSRLIDEESSLSINNSSNETEETITCVNKISLDAKANVKVEEHLNEVIITKNNITGDQGVKTSSIPYNCENLLTVHNDHEQTSNSNAATDTTDLLESIPKFQKANIDINFESHTAVCRRCSIILELDSKQIQNHIDEHKNNLQIKPTETTNEGKTKPKEISKQKNENDIRKLVEEHGLTYVSSEKRVYCQRCNKHIPSNKNNIKEHVNGELHRDNKLSSRPHLKDNDNKKVDAKKYNLKRMPTHMFIRTITSIKSLFSEDTVVNDKFCINMLAFTFLTMTAPGKIRCQVCETMVPLQDINEHVNLKRHDRAFNEVPMIINMDGEFIREIRSDLYQCGYCNIYESWEQMENHLKSTEHKESKTFANWRLSQHLPQIEQHRMERQIHNEFLTRLLF